jgi:AAA15 family ATPase/GTPase
VSLLDGVGVLVGRNGAGKSAILEGFKAVSSSAIGSYKKSRPFDVNSIPRILEVIILTPTERLLKYKYELVVAFTPTGYDDRDSAIGDLGTDILEENQFTWNESCRYIDEMQKFLWVTQMGITTFRGEEPTILGLTSILRPSASRRYLERSSRQLKFKDEMQWVFTVLNGVRLLGKTPIRQTDRRRKCLIQVSRKNFFSASISLDSEVDNLARRILNMNIEVLNEFENICQRIGLGNKITIQKFILSEESKEISEAENEEYITSVSLDGVNIGLLSDGTLRVLSLLISLITSHPSVTTIIEEPETQIHPGMLAKLLNEIETYTFGENLILSTHSPQVVGWTSPDKINLVYRNRGQTIVRKLDEEEIQKVVEYLYEEGDLGEWLYSGILDE